MSLNKGKLWWAKYSSKVNMIAMLAQVILAILVYLGTLGLSATTVAIIAAVCNLAVLIAQKIPQNLNIVGIIVDELDGEDYTDRIC